MESILLPSKEIKEGFETVIVLTLQGRVFHGMVIENTAEQIVLRNSDNLDQPVTISQEDIDEIQAGTKSIMPEGVVDQLKNRQQFLDLVRYVVEVKVRGPAMEGGVSRPVGQRELSPELNGLVSLHNLNGVACHKPATAPAFIQPKYAPNLKWSGQWLNPEHMARFIADPHATKPGTSMPQMLGHLDDPTRTQAARAITQFLISTNDGPFQIQPVEEEAATRGEELFHSVGCVACHAPRDRSGVEQPGDESIALGDLSGKYNVDGLVRFLEDPLAVRPTGRMPNMQLTHFEAIEIASYLLQGSEGHRPAWQADETEIHRGKELFTELGCTACHAAPTGSGELRPASQISLSQLRHDQGCLAVAEGDTGSWPQFHFRDQEVEEIRAALANFPDQLTNEQQIDVSLKTFNCVACHDRDDFGGVTAFRNPHFQTTNLNLGDQGRLPPTLTNVGAKLKAEWMRDVLVNGRMIRPYMKTRMPQYGEENIGHLTALFQATDQLPDIEFPSFEDQKEMRELGLQLAGNKGLNCVACHTYKFELSDTMPAVDLTEMSERLKKNWFHDYMQNPNKFSPGTVMPSFWPGGVAIRKDLKGDPSFQIEALWQYLIDGRQARPPSGIVRESLEIVVTDETKMLRRNYPTIGKRGIGVGYPGKFNLAFDAEQMRLGMIWRGRFVDPAAAWTGQGSGVVRPLGKPIHFGKGPDLDDASNPWQVDDGRPPKHQFQGYTLDENRRPVFRYAYDGIEVSDFFKPGSDEDCLQRRVTLTSPRERENLRFRIATAGSVTRGEDGQFSTDAGLKIRIVTKQSVETVADAGGAEQLQVSLSLAADEKAELVVEYFWK